MGIRNLLRKCGRSPYIGDLRIIKIEYRHLYKDRMKSGSLGSALQALRDAYMQGHLRP